MKAIILAAGKGARMGKLTENRPKALLTKNSKPLIRYALEILPPSVDEIIIAIEYLGDQIRTFIGDSWNGLPVRYVEQGEKKGTAGALWSAKEYLKGEQFLVLPCDDIFATQDILKVTEFCPAMLVAKVTDRVCPGGNVGISPNGFLISVQEGTHEPPCYISMSVYFLDDTIFGFEPVKIESKDEYGLPQTLAASAKNYPVRVVEGTSWVQIVTDKDVDGN
jgi:bifunctional UDP-N-acetylglucosamine pyrophosphorylase/glucosamine-1-phosphate N-acetyltransferase